MMKSDEINYSWLQAIEDFAEEDEHVKDVLLASMIEFGLVHEDLLDTLLKEYRDVSREFLDELIETNNE